MSLLTDHHVHCRKPHAEGELEEFVEVGLKRGLTGMVLLAHAPLSNPKLIPPEMEKPRMTKTEEVLEYRDEIRKIQKFYPNIDLQFGLEFDYLPNCEDATQELIRITQPDVIIGSVHYIFPPNEPLPSHEKLKKWWGELQFHPLLAQEIYYQTISNMGSNGLYHGIAHLDRCKRLCQLSLEEQRNLAKEALQVIKKYNVPVEINTSQLPKNLDGIQPGFEILEEVRAMGIDVFLSSDAHKPGDVAKRFGRAMEILCGLGYDHICNLSKGGARSYVSIDDALRHWNFQKSCLGDQIICSSQVAGQFRGR